MSEWPPAGGEQLRNIESSRVRLGRIDIGRLLAAPPEPLFGCPTYSAMVRSEFIPFSSTSKPATVPGNPRNQRDEPSRQNITSDDHIKTAFFDG